MHHALMIDEILLNVLVHFCQDEHDRMKPTSDLVTLARTCHAFKEPALDLLWKELDDLSPIARCIPDASHKSFINTIREWYSFSRPLTQAEWDVLRSYTRRVRSIRDFSTGVGLESIKTNLRSPTPDPLFPNLRHLRSDYNRGIEYYTPLLTASLPSLISLDVSFNIVRDLEFQNTLDLFAKSCPNIRHLRLVIQRPHPVGASKIISNCICRAWNNLHSLECPQTPLDIDALVHLSHMPTLTQLTFALTAEHPDELPPPDSDFNPLAFTSNLHELVLSSISILPIAHFLFRNRLPAITDLTAVVLERPSKMDLAYFFASVSSSGAGHTIHGLHLSESPSLARNALEVPFIGFQDLQPCMSFRCLRRIIIDVLWTVSLVDNELLTFASTWPQLEHLIINEKSGWNTSGDGITPDGLVRLLQTCPLLTRLALTLDTRGFTKWPTVQSESFATNLLLGSTCPASLPVLSMDVLDSAIKKESMEAMAAFFSDIMRRYDSSFRAWCGSRMVWRWNWTTYADRWSDVIVSARLSITDTVGRT